MDDKLLVAIRSIFIFFNFTKSSSNAGIIPLHTMTPVTFLLVSFLAQSIYLFNCFIASLPILFSFNSIIIELPFLSSKIKSIRPTGVSTCLPFKIRFSPTKFGITPDEKLKKTVEKIIEEFKKRGYDIGEDVTELVEERSDVAKALSETKFKNIEFFNVDEENSVGFTLEDIQVNFFLEYGEDEEGKWYEASAEIINF